jgi:myosin heavy subunit
VGSFLAKNSDAIPEALEVYVAESSKLSIFAKIHGDVDVHEIGKDASKDAPSSKGRKTSVATTFATQMNVLGNLLESTACSFVRCIKPNASMTAGLFDPRYVLEQLRSLGVVQTCEVLRAGLPTRITFAEIDLQLRPQLPASVRTVVAKLSSVEFTDAIFWAMCIDGQFVQRGKTRVFFKAGRVSVLYDILSVDLASPQGRSLAARLGRFVSWRHWRRAFVAVRAQNAFTAILVRRRLERTAGNALWASWQRYRRSKKLKLKRLMRRRWRVAIYWTVATNSFLRDLSLIQTTNEAQMIAEQDAKELIEALEVSRCDKVMLRFLSISPFVLTAGCG